MMTYKNIIKLFIIAIIAISCSSEKNGLDNVPQIYFEKPRYTFLGDECVIKLNTNVAFEQRTEVPFTIYTEDGQEGEDYNIKSKSFVFEKGEKEAKLVITPEEITKEMKLYINCTKAPEGYIVGLRDFTELNVANLKYSFTERSTTLSAVLNVEVRLLNSKNARFIVEEDYTAEVELAEGTTAEEGTHFAFVDKAEAVFKKGERSGFIKIKMLGKEDPAHNIIKLRIKTSNRLSQGNVNEITITIKEPVYIDGTWILAGISNKVQNDNNYGDFGLISPEFKTGNDKDKFIFTKTDDGTYSFTYNMVGELRNYFIEPQTITIAGTKFIRFNDSKVRGKRNVTEYLFPKVNYSISNSKSEIKEAKVSFYKINDDEMIMVIDKYNYNDVLNYNLGDYGMGSEDYPLNFLLKREQ